MTIFSRLAGDKEFTEIRGNNILSRGGGLYKIVVLWKLRVWEERLEEVGDVIVFGLASFVVGRRSGITSSYAWRRHKRESGANCELLK